MAQGGFWLLLTLDLRLPLLASQWGWTVQVNASLELQCCLCGISLSELSQGGEGDFWVHICHLSAGIDVQASLDGRVSVNHTCHAQGRDGLP